MGVMVQPRLLPSLIFFLSFFYVLSLSSSQSNSPQSTIPRSPNNPMISPALIPVMPPPPPPPSPDQTVTKAVVATAVSTLVVSGIFLFFFQRCAMARHRQRNKIDSSFRREEAVVSNEEFKQLGGTLKGLIVDDNGLDVLYWRKLEGGQLKTSFSKVLINPNEEEKRVDTEGDGPKKSEPVQEIPLLLEKVAKPVSLIPTPRPPVSAPPLQPVFPQPQPPRPPPPPVIPMKQIPPPPPPPPIPAKKIPAPPPPPPMLPKRNPAPPPPPPKAGGLVSSLKPPPVPRRKSNSNSMAEDSTEESLKGTGVGQMKLKPLHWDKVIANADHSMVWDEINNGSFRFDNDLMETLFGYTATNQKSPEITNISSSSSSSNSAPPAQIFILEPRKSQNTAIVLRSLAISRKEILDALLDGEGLNADSLEKLTKISPTQEEEAKILQFNGNPTKLADAESFLYHILKAVPSAFTRFNSMLFRSNYDPEILHLKESLQTLELGCKELRTRGIFLKLLEAILKAGNRMNSGTARGNAQGFNLTALRKLSDVKSTDGKTTLLHFVVEQVVRSEGRRCVINRNYSLGRSTSQRSKNSDSNPDSLKAQEERDKEYLMLGLPVLGGLSVEFSNVKKAATIDYESFINMFSSLTARVTEIQQLVTHCGNGERGGFVREMKGFLEECKEELKVVREEQTRVMELVKRTTEYYQAGASKDKGAHPLQLFVMVKDFLDMVDQVCLDITRKIQKKNMTTSVGLSPPSSPSKWNPVRFPNLQSHFMSDKSRTTPSSSDSEDDF